jgi:hypothetical protein
VKWGGKESTLGAHAPTLGVRQKKYLPKKIRQKKFRALKLEILSSFKRYVAKSSKNLVLSRMVL